MGGSLKQNLFGMHLVEDEVHSGLITFGRVPMETAAPGAALHWMPTNTDSIWWEMNMHDVLIDGQSAGLCEDGDCIAVADSGCTDINGPDSAITLLQEKFSVASDCSD